MPSARSDFFSSPPESPWSRCKRRAWREWCFARAALRHFRVRLLVMFFVLLIGGVAFENLGSDPDVTLMKALYSTWSLILGEPPAEFPESYLLEALYFVVPVIGLTIIIEGIIDFSWMLRDRRRYEQSWCLMMASSMKNHIIVVGLGKVGFRTYNILRRLGEKIVVVEINDQSPFLEAVRENGDPLLIGDGRRDQLLREANIEAARSVVVSTDDDLANLEIALDARRFNPKVRVILRMFDQDLADKIRDGFDIHLAMSPSAICAPSFALAAVNPSILSSFVLDGRLVVMLRWSVQEGGPLCHKTVAQLQHEFRIGVTRLLTKAGETRLFPPADTVLAEGDELLVQGLYDDLEAMKDDETGEPPWTLKGPTAAGAARGG